MSITTAAISGSLLALLVHELLVRRRIRNWIRAEDARMYDQLRKAKEDRT